MVVFLTLGITLISSFLGLVNISLLYLLPVLLSAARWGTFPAIVTAMMGTLTFDIFFVPPIFSITVADLRYLISFAIFILVGLITGTLSVRLKKQVTYSRQRENSISSLYALSRDIAAVDNLDAVLECIVSNVSNTLDGQAMVLLPNEKARLVLRKDSGLNNFYNDNELAEAIPTPQNTVMNQLGLLPIAKVLALSWLKEAVSLPHTSSLVATRNSHNPSVYSDNQGNRRVPIHLRSELECRSIELDFDVFQPEEFLIVARLVAR